MASSHEKRLSKLQVLVTDSELSDIDDWRFDKRADNRSSAVRELIALGLLMSEREPEAVGEALDKLRTD